MHEGDAAPTGPSATAAAVNAAAATGADAAATAADAAAPAADVTAVDVAVARMGVGTAISSPRTGAQPPTAIKGTGTSTNDCVGPTGSVATCRIGSGSVCTVGGTANSRTGSGTPAPRLGPPETSPPWAASQQASGAPSSATSGENVVVLREVLMRKFAKRRAEDALEANTDSGTVEPTTPKQQCKEEQSESQKKLRTMSWRPNGFRKESEKLAAKEEEDLLAKDPRGDTARCAPSEV